MIYIYTMVYSSKVSKVSKVSKLLLLPLTNGFLWQQRSYTKTIGQKSIDVYEARNAKTSMIFFTGLFNQMPNFIYSDLLKSLSQEGITCYSLQDSIDAKVYSFIESNTKTSTPVIAAHSSGSVPALELASIAPIEKIILFDPVGLPSIPPHQYTLKRATDIMFVNAELSYEWRGLSDIPFIPSTFAITEKDLDTPANISCISSKYHGHGDILNNFWADVSASTGIIRGHEERDERVNQNYRDWIIEQVVSFIEDDTNQDTNQQDTSQQDTNQQDTTSLTSLTSLTENENISNGNVTVHSV